MLDRLVYIEQRYEEIERQMADPRVSADYARTQVLSKEYASLRELVNLYREYQRVSLELEEVRTMSQNEADRELASLAREECTKLQEKQEEIERKTRVALLPKDSNDDKNVIMEIRAGIGGEEASLFAGDLYRMYVRYAQRNGWKVEIVNTSETGLGGIKEVVYQIKGDGAYSRLKHESGGHRVQRIPLTESSGRIHTSAATVAVLPEAAEVDVHIRPEELQIDIFHASGHGGQNVQKVATAVRITHVSTGIVAMCQDERSQFKNKAKAMAVLRSRVLAREIQRQQDEVSAERRSQIGSGDRSERVRTYNFPQNRVTDHRTSLTSHSLELVLDGDLDQFVDALISMEQTLKIGDFGL